MYIGWSHNTTQDPTRLRPDKDQSSLRRVKHVTLELNGIQINAAEGIKHPEPHPRAPQLAGQ